MQGGAAGLAEVPGGILLIGMLALAKSLGKAPIGIWARLSGSYPGCGSCPARLPPSALARAPAQQCPWRDCNSSRISTSSRVVCRHLPQLFKGSTVLVGRTVQRQALRAAAGRQVPGQARGPTATVVAWRPVKNVLAAPSLQPGFGASFASVGGRAPHSRNMPGHMIRPPPAPGQPCNGCPQLTGSFEPVRERLLASPRPPARRCRQTRALHPNAGG